MLGFKDGKYQEVDTSGSWPLAILLTFIVMLPVYIIWHILKAIFTIITHKKNK